MSHFILFKLGHFKNYILGTGQRPHIRAPPLSSSWKAGSHSPPPALEMQALSWGPHGTDLTWTTCIFILCAAVLGETAVLRCLIIPHL